MRILAGIVLTVGIICVITFKPVQNNASNKKRKTSENGALMENGEGRLFLFIDIYDMFWFYSNIRGKTVFYFP